MTKEELRQLSDQTFYDNKVGGITPPLHRAFNDTLIANLPELASNVVNAPAGLVRGGMDPGQIRVESDGTMILPLADNYEAGIVKGSTSVGKMSVDTDGNMKLNGWANVPSYTYVVDSDEALAQFANNAPGNDYTSVLIRKGDWTLTRVLLFTPVTKVIQGEPGSRIIIDISPGSASNTSWIIGPNNPTRLTNYNRCDLYDITLYIRNTPLNSLIAYCGYVHNLNITQDETALATPLSFISSCLHVADPKIQVKTSLSKGYKSIKPIENCTTIEGAYMDVDINAASSDTSIQLISGHRMIRCIVNAKIEGTSNVIGVSDGMDVEANELTFITSRTLMPNTFQGFYSCHGMRCNSVKNSNGWDMTKYQRCYSSRTSSQSAGDSAAGGFNS